MERILQSRWLKDSRQLSGLLRFIVEETLAGREDGLKEYALGLQVFHRPPDYDPRSDAIVRVQASLLRKRLAAFYENEGRDSSVRIELPKGGYVPEFREAAAPAPVPAMPETRISRRASSRRGFLTGLAAGILLSLGVFGLRTAPGVHRSECPALWKAYLDPRTETVVSFGVPLFFSGGGGLFVRDTHVNQLSDDQSRIERVGEILGRRLRPQADVYTGIGDAIGAHQIARWLEMKGIRVQMANSNYLGPSDVENRNLVVVASARFQTLLQSLDRPRAIWFDPNDEPGGMRIDNPLPDEQAIYRPRTSDMGVSTSYALVTLWPGLRSSSRILYLSGIETWSTQGAAQYVLNDGRMRELQQILDRDPEDGPRGRRSPCFQVLLRVEAKGNAVRNAQYLTHRYLPAGAVR